MAVTLEVTKGAFFGPDSNVSSYSVSEQATPLDPNDSRGSVGSITVDVAEKVGPHQSRGMIGGRGTLRDETNGYTGGRIVGVSNRDGHMGVDIDSELAFAVQEITALPFRGTIEGVIRYWFGIVGTVGGFYFDPAIPKTTFAFPGWSGDLWVNTKALLSVYRLDLSYTSGMITVRPARQRELVRYRDVSNSWDIPASEVARYVDIYYYENKWSDSALAYPVGGRSDDERVISVNYGEQTVIEVKMAATLKAVSQPVPRMQDESPPANSGYTIIDKDGVPVDGREWEGNGGFVRAEIDPVDPSVLHITVQAMRVAERSPYRLATRMDENDYPSLIIMGQGTFTNKSLLHLPTGADEALITTDIGATVDNPFIGSRTEAYDAGLRTARRYAGPDMNISFSSWRVNALGATDSTRQLTFDDFNAEWDARNPSATFASFNTYWASTPNFAGFNAFYEEKYQLEYQNQAFGNVAGARMFEDDAFYRVRSATITEAGVTGTAEHDTMFGDFNSVWQNAKFNDFNARWAGKKFDDLTLAPLWR